MAKVEMLDNMERFFAHIVSNYVVLEDEDAHHLVKVMRARSGDNIEVVCDERLFLCKIESIKPLKIKVVKNIDENHELPNDVVLIASVLKGPKMEFVLQKATELGAEEIVLLESERTIARVRLTERAFKLERYSRILKEACQQCKRTRIPLLYQYIDIKEIDKVRADIKLVAYEEVAGSTSKFHKQLERIKPGQRIAILIGPEGGFSKDEIDFLKSHGYKCVSLGRRILRAETASLNALSVIANYLEKD